MIQRGTVWILVLIIVGSLVFLYVEGICKAIYVKAEHAPKNVAPKAYANKAVRHKGIICFKCHDKSVALPTDYRKEVNL